jgi:general secretion pathway protein L
MRLAYGEGLPRILRPLVDLFDALVDGVEPLARRFAARRRWVAIEEEGGFVVHRLAGHRLERVGRVGAGSTGADPALRAVRGGRVELRLDPSRVLTRRLNLPAAGAEYLGAIIEHRLDRLTPWRPDKVAYGFALRPGVGADGTIAVDFAATSQEALDATLAMFAAAGLAISAVGSAADPADGPLGIDLMRGGADAGRQRLRRIVGWAIVVAFALLVPAAAASQYLLNSAVEESAGLDARLHVKQAVVRRALGAGEAGGRDRELIAAKTEAASVALLIDRLAGLLPDDTYLRELSIDSDTVRLAGRSADAPALIGLIEADPWFSGVRFAAPVMRADDGREDFDITARRDHPADEAAGAPSETAPGATPEVTPGVTP